MMTTMNAMVVAMYTEVVPITTAACVQVRKHRNALGGGGEDILDSSASLATLMAQRIYVLSREGKNRRLGKR